MDQEPDNTNFIVRNPLITADHVVGRGVAYTAPFFRRDKATL